MKTRKDGEMNLPPSLVECTKCGEEIKGYLNRHKCESQHTPAPWRYDRKNGRIYDKEASKLITICDLPNAAFIVRAVNSHEALLSALDSIAFMPTSEATIPKMRELAHKAIAKAEGK